MSLKALYNNYNPFDMKFTPGDVLILISWIGKLVTSLFKLDRNKDGKISGSEILSLVTASADLDFIVTLPRIKTTLSELTKTDRAGRLDLIREFSESFKLDNLEAEKLFEQILQSSNLLATSIVELTRISKKAA